ncbi:hypothetical protein [Botrimarina sp.]|uniref:hypothetical protein n=1 Tax=Botrimarina sp. TaxID=2795802 RepID=UPI0032ED033D
MLKRTLVGLALVAPASLAHAQVAVEFRDGVTMLPGGGLYDGTIDTEFRAANPTTEQGENQEISVDDFDGGFQTQGAIRFENLLVSDGGLVPDGLNRDQILFAEFRLWKTSPTASDAIINFNRIVGPDTSTGQFWQEDDTWASLGGDLIPDQGGFLDGDPILEDGIEAATTPDFQDGFPLGDFTQPRDTGIYASSNDGEDLISIFTGQLAADPNNPTPEELSEIIDRSFFRYDVTDAVRDWLVDGDPNYGWSINNNTGDGWDMVSSDLVGDENGEVEQGGFQIQAVNLRPSLTIIYSQGPRGDLDFDGDVDLDDYQVLLDNLAIELNGPIATGATGDLDFDRDVDLDDFALFKGFYEDANGAGALASAVAAPEPSAALLAVVCGLFGAVRRR